MKEIQQNEIDLAEAHLESMPADVKQATAKRSENWEQIRTIWEDYGGDNLDGNFVRKKPTAEQKEKMDLRLRELGELFDGADFPWQLDGAFNISLRKGEYIGFHKDVDITVNEEDLNKLDKQLLKKGYGLFLSLRRKDHPGAFVMRRVNGRQFAEAEDHQIIMAINQEGKIVDEKELNGIDVHITKRNKEGAIVNADNTPLPEKWYEPQPLSVFNHDINLSHPARVAYFKLRQGRNYDLTDLKQFVQLDVLTNGDVDDIEKVVRADYQSNLDKAKGIFDEIAAKLKPTMNAGEINDVIINHPAFAPNKEHMVTIVRTMSEELAKKEKVSGSDIFEMILKHIDPDNQQLEKKLRGVKDLKRWVEEAKSIKAIKNRTSEM